MKAVLLSLFLLLFPVAVSQAQNGPYPINHPSGPFVAIVNPTGIPASCFLRDRYNFFTFALYPGYTSMWYPIYGQYEWRCTPIR
jgi:hypothetical protein